MPRDLITTIGKIEPLNLVSKMRIKCALTDKKIRDIVLYAIKENILRLYKV